MRWRSLGALSPRWLGLQRLPARGQPPPSAPACVFPRPFGPNFPRGGGSRFCATSALQGSVDRFGGVHVKVEKEDVADLAAFRGRLRAALAEWQGSGRCAVWVSVPNASAGALPVLLEEGFDWHHARPEHSLAGPNEGGYALLAKWLLADEPSRLPIFATTQVGVGGLVVNSAGEVLLMKERVSLSAKIHNLWKLPGGLADPGEDLVAAAAREVWEETGVRASAEGLLCIHHRHGMRHGLSDLYFTVRMRAETEELCASSSETMAATWMPLAEAQTSPEVMDFNRRILALAECPKLVPHRGSHGSTIVKGEYYLYAAAQSLDPETGKPSGSS